LFTTKQKLRCNWLPQGFFNKVAGKKNKHKNQKAIWVEHITQNTQFELSIVI
jgi:hypothetical protein